MAITAADVKKLRDATGAGMMDAKKALTEADGDFERAAELLRVTGAVKNAKRSDREARNGLVIASGPVMVQLGAETDFVAKNAEFIELAESIVKAIEAERPADKEATAGLTLPSGGTVEEAIAALASKIGEKLELAELAVFEGQVHSYLHRRSLDLPPQVGVLVEFTGDDEDFVHQVAMQIASMRAQFLTRADVPADLLETERRIAEETAREEGKPEQIIPRIVDGRINAFYKDVVLLEQPALVDDKKTVGQLADAAGVTITRFARFATGA